MRKMIIPVITLTVALIASGCASGDKANESAISSEDQKTVTEQTEEETGEGTMNLPNPWSEYVSLDEANQSAGINFMLPDEYKTDGNVYRAISGNMIEILVPTGDNVICIRASAATDEDITGDYNNYDYSVDEHIRNVNVSIRGSEMSSIHGASWSDDNLSYSVSFESEATHEDAVDLIASIIIENTEAY